MAPDPGQGTVADPLRGRAVESVNVLLQARLRLWRHDDILDRDETCRQGQTETDWTATLERPLDTGRATLCTLSCPLAAAEADDPLIANCAVTHGLILRLDKFLFLLATAALSLGRPVQAVYAYYGETYRAHPDGRLELVDEAPKRR